MHTLYKYVCRNICCQCIVIEAPALGDDSELGDGEESVVEKVMEEVVEEDVVEEVVVEEEVVE